MLSDEAPIVASAGRRVRLEGISAWTAATRIRRWPPGVIKEEIWPRSAHRRSVFGATPRVRLACPSVSQRLSPDSRRLALSFLAKTT